MRLRLRGGQDDWWVVAVVCLVIFVLVLWFHAEPLGHFHTGDTDNLVVGVRQAADCIRAGTWVACGRPPGSRFTYVYPYPPLQYIPAGVFVALGQSNADVVEALARTNIVAFAATILVCAWAFPSGDRRARRALAILALLASSLVYHSTAGFGEMLAAAVVAAAVVAALKRRPALIVLTVALATLGKDTLLPFILGLCVLCAREEGRLLPPRRVSIALAVGACLGAAAVAAFNVFRFGQLMNAFYLDPLFRTPGIARKLLFLAGEWLSPSAGLAWYWPVATALVGACTLMAAARLVRQPRAVEGWLPGLALAAMAVVFTAGLAAWFSPFGWIAYGPRLAVPLMPALVIAALHVGGSSIDTAMKAVLRRRAGFAVAATLIVAAGWPQFGSAWSSGAAIGDLIAPDTRCPPMMDTPIENNRDRYYDCVEHTMWRLNSLPLDEAAREGGGAAAVGRHVLAAATIALLASARRTSRARVTERDQRGLPVGAAGIS
jgi:hypothetical protein